MDLQVLTTEFLASKAAAGRAGTTVDFYYWQFKGFMEWCERENYTDSDLMGSVGAETIEDHQLWIILGKIIENRTIVLSIEKKALPVLLESNTHMVSYIQDCSPIPGDGTARCWPGSLRRNVTEVFGPLQNLLSMPGVGDYTDNFISRQTVHHPRQWAIGAVWSVAGTAYYYTSICKICQMGNRGGVVGCWDASGGNRRTNG